MNMWNEFRSFLSTLLANTRFGEYSGAALAKVQEGPSSLFGLDLTIEGLNSHRYSIAIFVFLIMQVILFAFMIYIYMKKSKRVLKTGEKVMFGALIMGIIIGVTFGWTQMIEGYLF
ncbi:MAG: hypothetical protein HYX62_04130 [Gammaproteobacteria bacterium]|jgi:hypothetical protein|nr:hypothetical protein [Gammaproteobacteria bacterium]